MSQSPLYLFHFGVYGQLEKPVVTVHMERNHKNNAKNCFSYVALKVPTTAAKPCVCTQLQCMLL